MCDEPRVKLQERNEHEHGDDCKPILAKNEERENTRNCSEDNTECNGHRPNQRGMLKVLLCSKIIGEDTAFAGSVVDEVLYERENPAEEVDGCVSERSVTGVLNALVGVIVE